MNHFSYESIGKDKIQNLQQEGMRSQAYHGDGSQKFKFIRSPKMFLLLLLALGVLSVFWH